MIQVQRINQGKIGLVKIVDHDTAHINGADHTLLGNQRRNGPGPDIQLTQADIVDKL